MRRHYPLEGRQWLSYGLSRKYALEYGKLAVLPTWTFPRIWAGYPGAGMKGISSREMKVPPR
eukprot:1181967-Prorocentrum_minimum.AAC.2